MVKIVKNPGNGRLNNLNDPVLNVLICSCCCTVRDVRDPNYVVLILLFPHRVFRAFIPNCADINVAVWEWPPLLLGSYHVLWKTVTAFKNYNGRTT